MWFFVFFFAMLVIDVFLAVFTTNVIFVVFTTWIFVEIDENVGMNKTRLFNNSISNCSFREINKEDSSSLKISSDEKTFSNEDSSKTSSTIFWKIISKMFSRIFSFFDTMTFNSARMIFNFVKMMFELWVRYLILRKRYLILRKRYLILRESYSSLREQYSNLRFVDLREKTFDLRHFHMRNYQQKRLLHWSFA